MEAGLCATCRWCQVVATTRSRFYLCRRSFTDPQYRKYPPVPVRFCPGYEAGPPAPPAAPTERS